MTFFFFTLISRLSFSNISAQAHFTPTILNFMYSVLQCLLQRQREGFLEKCRKSFFLYCVKPLLRNENHFSGWNTFIKKKYRCFKGKNWILLQTFWEYSKSLEMLEQVHLWYVASIVTIVYKKKYSKYFEIDETRLICTQLRAIILE